MSGTLILCASMLVSCGTVYKYVQVCTAKPIPNATTVRETRDGLLYENEDCIVRYNLWSNGGTAGFMFYNKTNEVIHIDLSQTFFIKNGVAYDYDAPQTIAGTSEPMAIYTSWSTAILGNLTTTNTTCGISASITTSLQPTLSIPPKSSKIVSGYDISKELFHDCELIKYPSDSAHLSFDEKTSPLTFANYITYSVGNNQANKAIENKFYIADVANYAEPYILIYTARKETCENVLSPEEAQRQKNAPKIYDAYLNVTGENSFYMTYSTFSNIRLYTAPKGSKHYQWISYYNGYTTY